MTFSKALKNLAFLVIGITLIITVTIPIAVHYSTLIFNVSRCEFSFDGYTCPIRYIAVDGHIVTTIGTQANLHILHVLTAYATVTSIQSQHVTDIVTMDYNIVK